MNVELLHRLAIALGLGLIVGLERAWKTQAEHGGLRPAGVRTFGLAGVLGGALAIPGLPGSLPWLTAGLLVLGVLTVRAYAVNARQTGDLGLTTELALLTTYGLGAAAVSGYPVEAVAVAVLVALLLGLKPEFHHLVEGLERHELLATLKLLLIAAVLVPLLPARDMGPWQAVNPRSIGLLVLLIAGLSYVGYFAVRVLGSRLGLLLTALLGGLSSSTASPSPTRGAPKRSPRARRCSVRASRWLRPRWCRVSQSKWPPSISRSSAGSHRRCSRSRSCH